MSLDLTTQELTMTRDITSPPLHPLPRTSLAARLGLALVLVALSVTLIGALLGCARKRADVALAEHASQLAMTDLATGECAWALSP